MALKEDELRKISSDYIEMFDRLEADILKELGKFIKNNQASQAYYNVKLLKNLGTTQDKIKRMIEQTLKKVPGETTRLFKDIANVSDTRELVDYLKNGYEVKPLEKSELMQRLINNHIKAAEEYITKYVKSIGFAGTSLNQVLLKATDYVALQTASGAVTYDQAVETATKDLAKKGLTTISYASGSVIDLQSGIRRIVITEGNQMALRMTEERVIESGVKYVEISSHAGARPEHAKWQGRVIKFKDLRSITGYGRVDGLGGANCRHTFHPYFENGKAPKEPEPKPKKYNDKTYTLYEAEQKQRYYERNIRALKRELIILEEAGADTSQVQAQLTDWRRNYREFSKAMDLRTQSNRTRVY